MQAEIPPWIKDKQNQGEWNDRFVGILRKDYGDSDPTITAILSNERLAEACATKIRFYVDKHVTSWFNRDRKARKARHKEVVESAIAGLNAAIGLYSERGKSDVAQYLATLALDLSAELGRSKDAFATKRHGRDRDHAMLYECQMYLEWQLGQDVTYATLASLLNAGYEADGSTPKDPVTEENVRKNLATFRKHNPVVCDLVNQRYPRSSTQPETKPS